MVSRQAWEWPGTRPRTQALLPGLGFGRLGTERLRGDQYPEVWSFAVHLGQHAEIELSQRQVTEGVGAALGGGAVIARCGWAYQCVQRGDHRRSGLQVQLTRT
jgi:hypothetical protein